MMKLKNKYALEHIYNKVYRWIGVNRETILRNGIKIRGVKKLTDKNCIEIETEKYKHIYTLLENGARIRKVEVRSNGMMVKRINLLKLKVEKEVDELVKRALSFM